MISSYWSEVACSLLTSLFTGRSLVAVSSNWMEISLICWVTLPPLSLLSGPQIMGLYYFDQCVIARTHRSEDCFGSHHEPIMLWAPDKSHICLSHQWDYKSLWDDTKKKSSWFPICQESTVTYKTVDHITATSTVRFLAGGPPPHASPTPQG